MPTSTPTATGPTPAVDRPRMPDEYGMPASTEGLIEWQLVDDRFRDANVYWIGTSSSAGRPAVRPVDGIWLDGVLYVGGSPETLWVRNLTENPCASIHLDGGWDVAILEGEAEHLVNGVEPALAERLAAESNRKYPQYGVKAKDYVGRPAGFAIRPMLGLAWKDFPKDLTRFRFDRG